MTGTNFRLPYNRSEASAGGPQCLRRPCGLKGLPMQQTLQMAQRVMVMMTRWVTVLPKHTTIRHIRRRIYSMRLKGLSANCTCQSLFTAHREDTACEKSLMRKWLEWHHLSNLGFGLETTVFCHAVDMPLGMVMSACWSIGLSTTSVQTEIPQQRLNCRDIRHS